LTQHGFTVPPGFVVTAAAYREFIQAHSSLVADLDSLQFEDPEKVMMDFAAWLRSQRGDRPIFISDNNGFDWMFICWYFHHFTGSNPFGYSSYNLGSLYKGIVKDTFSNFKHLRKTAHTHHPVDDAKGNAEALLILKKEQGLKIKL